MEVRTVYMVLCGLQLQRGRMWVVPKHQCGRNGSWLVDRKWGECTCFRENCIGNFCMRYERGECKSLRREPR